MTSTHQAADRVLTKLAKSVHVPFQTRLNKTALSRVFTIDDPLLWRVQNGRLLNAQQSSDYAVHSSALHGFL